MAQDRINYKYLDWMYRLVCEKKRVSYRNLLNYLHGKEFTYILGLDGNRAEDGIDLRYRFAYEFKYPDSYVASYLDTKPCSVLEMLIALSMRCEEHIMDDPDIGNRTGQWFWSMIRNLGLIGMTDENFNEHHANRIIDRFLNRKYDRDGQGGLFIIPNCNRDLRSVEIWYQMMWYLDTVLELGV